MPSERIQRRIDLLLDRAEAALDAQQWAQVKARCEEVLALDPGNSDAPALLSVAERHLNEAGAPADSATSRTSSAAFAIARPEPASFAGGRYTVRALLGEGGTKRVYRARDERLDRDVAVAVVMKDGLTDDERERVSREARALGRLSEHPGIVTVFEAGEEDGQPYLVTELMRGGDLAQVISTAVNHRLELPRVLAVGAGIAAALAFVHENGVVHRDLKPGNVWLTGDGTPKLGDFGLALAAESSRLTRMGMMVGTALYLAPEQAMGQAVTPRSDLYSLGCLLYELLCGRPPFIGDDTIAIIGQHLHANPVAPSWHRPDCPRRLEDLVLRLLEKDPGKRPGSAQDVVEALRDIAGPATSSPPSANAGREDRSTPPNSDGVERQAGASAPPEQITTGSPGGPASNPIYRRIFVGREQELHALERSFDAAASGQGTLVVVVGEPGIGKTTLTEQLQTYATLRGGKTLVGHCYEEGSLSLPYLPFVEALRSYVLQREPDGLKSELGGAAADVARIVSEVRDRVQISPSLPSSDPGEDRYRLFSAVGSFLRSAGQVQPLVMVLEDLHDADRGTLELLQFLTRQLAGARLLLVGTYRDVEVDRQHPLSAALAELRRGGRLERITLRGLPPDEVQRMLSAIAAQDVQRPLAEAVFRQTEGNPLFVQEVVRYLAEAGLIQREGGQWRAGAGVSLVETIPEGLRDVIGKRMARLSPACNQVLAVASVIGRDFDLATLHVVAALPETELLEAVEEALKVAVLQDTSRPGVLRYRFTHALFRQLLYEELFAPRRLRIHQQVARALEQQLADRLDEHASELAEHFAQSTDPEDLRKAIEYSDRAAARAVSVYAYGEAVRLLERALQLQEVLEPGDMRARCRRLLDLCDALQAADEPGRVEAAVAEEAFALAERLGDGDAAARAALSGIWSFGWARGMPAMQSPRGREWARRVERHARPGTREAVLAKVLHSFSSRAESRHHELLQGLVEARAVGDADTFHLAAWIVLSDTGLDWEQAVLPLIAELEARHNDGAGVPARFHSRCAAAFAWLREGEREPAETIARELLALARRVPESSIVALSLALEAVFLSMDGHLDEAVLTMNRLPGETGNLNLRTAVTLPLFMLGRVDEFFALKPTAGVWDAYYQALAGRMADARRVLEDVVPEKLILGWAVIALAGAVLQGDRAQALVERAVSQWRPVVGTWWSVTDRHLGEAYAFLGEAQEARRRFEAAIALGLRMRWRPELALARLGLAELLAGTGGQAERSDAVGLLAAVVPELQAMKMQPALDRAAALEEHLRVGRDEGRPGHVVAAEEQATPSAASPPKRQVFISYASADRAPAVELAALLEQAGQTVWLDERNIAGGAGWDEEIVNGIRTCSVFAVLCSAAAMASPNVQQELRLAMQYRKPILPLRLGAAEFPAGVEYILAGRQWVELLDRPQDEWLPRVLVAIERLA